MSKWSSGWVLEIVSRRSAGADIRLHWNVGSCAPDVHMDLNRFFVVDMAQTSIQFPLQPAQLETQSHISIVGAHFL
jgi:hypothetical protein